MSHKTRWIVIGTGVVLLVSGGATVAVASSSHGDQALDGTTLDQASAAALADTHGGTVTEAEVGEDGAAYDVQVKLDSGAVVKVSLDAGFNVISQVPDDDDGAPDNNADSGPTE